MLQTAYASSPAIRALAAIRLILTRSPSAPCPLLPSFTARLLVSSTPSRASSTDRPHHSKDSRSSSDPLNPQLPTTPLGLPIHPLPPPIPQITPVHLSREALHRLHRLSALDPPEADSEEEKRLISELGELIGLMDLVKSVELYVDKPGDGYSELLGRGVGELVLDFKEEEGNSSSARNVHSVQRSQVEGEGKSGKDLLEYATRRVGDYYASRIAKKV